MSLATKTLSLASAVLSGGARIASAGGGLPQRITTEDDLLLPNNLPYLFGNVVFDSNNDMWVSSFNLGSIRKYNLAGDLLDTIGPISSPMGIYLDGNDLWIGVYGEIKARRYDVTNVPAVLQYTTPVLATRPSQVFPHSALASDIVWLKTYSAGPFEEWNTTTDTMTGRSIPGSVLAALPDLDGFWIADGSTIRHWLVSDLSNDRTYSPGYGITHPGWVWSGFMQSLGFDGTYVYVNPQIFGDIFRITASDALFDRRILSATPETGAATGASGWTQKQMPSFSSDGNYMAIMNSVPATGTYRGLIIRRSTHRARWSWAPGGPVTVQYLLVPGGLCRTQDASNDLRKARCYYSLNGGVDRTEFTPGSPISVAVSSTQTLTIDVDMENWQHLDRVAPWVGGDAGEGITFLYTDSAVIKSGRIVVKSGRVIRLSVAGKTVKLGSVSDTIRVNEAPTIVRMSSRKTVVISGQ